MYKELEIEEDSQNEDIIEINNPFSTKDISINNRVITLSSLLDRLQFEEIDLNPDFQRNADLWNKNRMSRLIESILLKLPLPIFYFDVSNPDKWIVVDGLQRLSTIKNFIIDESFKLQNLEFLNDLGGKKYSELPRNLKRIINETQINTYQIEAQTPKQVRYSIFHRINTGGLPLNSQEIRQALNQEGGSIEFLKSITEDERFKNIVAVNSKRMADRELVLRFIAFKLLANDAFTFNTMGEFLDYSMDKLNQIKDENILNEIRKDFLEVLMFSEKILGKHHYFSRAIADENKPRTLNRSLFDVITVSFSNIKNKEAFLAKKDLFLKKFIALLQNEESGFVETITKGTSSKRAVETRFRIMGNLIDEVLNEN